MKAWCCFFKKITFGRLKCWIFSVKSVKGKISHLLRLITEDFSLMAGEVNLTLDLEVNLLTLDLGYQQMH